MLNLPVEQWKLSIGAFVAGLWLVFKLHIQALNLLNNAFHQ